MKKIQLALIALGILALPVLAFAQPSVTVNSLDGLIESIKSFIWIIFGLIVVIAFITSAILFLTAGGAPEKIASARSAFVKQ
jgi:hypothetical protein